MSEDSFLRYLAAKRTVDDRAIHRPTLDRLRRRINRLAADRTATDGPFRIVDVGAGIGTMLDRAIEWGLLPLGSVEYVGVDRDETCVRTARQRAGELDALAAGTDPGGAPGVDRAGRASATEGSPPDSIAIGGGEATPERPVEATLRWSDRETTLEVSHVVDDALSFVSSEEEIDLLVGVSFLDLVELSTGLKRLWSGMADGGVAYFPITFDGVTLFRPVDDPEFEEHLLAAYHATMNHADRPGHSQTGRRVLDTIREGPVDLLAAGSSDWVVHPTPMDTDGKEAESTTGNGDENETAIETAGQSVSIDYPADEAFFLRYIVDTVCDAVGAIGEDDWDRLECDPIDPVRLESWRSRRHGQIDDRELIYVGHQYDLLVGAR